MKTTQPICCINQLSGFNWLATLAFNGLNTYCEHCSPHDYHCNAPQILPMPCFPIHNWNSIVCVVMFLPWVTGITSISGFWSGLFHNFLCSFPSFLCTYEWIGCSSNRLFFKLRSIWLNTGLKCWLFLKTADILSKRLHLDHDFEDMN